MGTEGRMRELESSLNMGGTCVLCRSSYLHFIILPHCPFIHPTSLKCLSIGPQAPSTKLLNPEIFSQR